MSVQNLELDLETLQEGVFHESLDGSQGIEVDFVTLGMFIIDEIHFQPPKPPVTGILGGAGAFAAMGARTMSPGSKSKSVGWIIDAGYDFPDELRVELAKWQTSCLLRDTPWRRTTRGFNEYGANEERGFKYLTPKLRLDDESLNEQLLCSNSFHLICSPTRCIDLVEKIEEKRRKLGLETRPLWIWEPVPDLAIPEELEKCRSALKLIDVVSPNHIELCNFFGKSAYDAEGYVDKQMISDLCSSWHRSGVGSVVVRAGKDGCYVASTETGWMPPYHTDSSKVIDPTGGGNAFLGAMAITLARNRRSSKSEFKKVWDAACAGSIAASFAIEQVGVPTLELRGNKEWWNGQDVLERLEVFKRKL